MPVSPELSVVIPIYNEAPNLEQLYRECTDALERWGRPYELLFVDDGSTDDSFGILKRVQQADRRVRVIRFRRNFGQTAAFAAGFALARGRLIATSDGDLQNDPKDLPALVARSNRASTSSAAGARIGRTAFSTRRLPSMIANKVISWATGVRLNDYGCSLKVFRAEVVKPLRLYGELHRFLPALASEMGVRIAELPVNHRARVHGQSKYGICAHDSRAARSDDRQVPVELLDAAAADLRAARPGDGLRRLGDLRVPRVREALRRRGRRRARRVTGRRSCSAILLFFTGVQLFTLGLLAELQARTYHESQDKPVYVIREVLESSHVTGDVAPIERERLVR